jgi:hypothetical protein
MQDSQPKNSIKRYASAAVIIGGGAVLGSSALMASYSQQNHGVPITHQGQKYFIQKDSKRVMYPSREACLKEVPAHMQKECEPVANYRSGMGWYGPVYSPGDATGYRPSGKYPTEMAGSSNVGKQLPSGANATGFGANGKALTGKAGG